MPSGRNIIFLSLHGWPERRSLLLQSLQLETITDLVDILSKDGRLIARKIRVSPCFLDKQREKPNFSLIQQKEGEEDRELKSFSIPQFHVQSHVSMLYSPISYTITYFCNHVTVDRFSLDLKEKKNSMKGNSCPIHILCMHVYQHPDGDIQNKHATNSKTKAWKGSSLENAKMWKGS